MTLKDLITEGEAEKLMFVVKTSKRGIGATTHNIVMKWLDSQPEVMERFRIHGVLKPYGAYMLEHFLKL